MRGEQSQGMSRIQHQGLLVRHLREVLHGQTVLRPVLEGGAVASVDDQLVGMLGDGHVQVVGDHKHYGRCLTALMGEVVDAAGVDLIVRTEPVHVDTSVGLELFLELGNQSRMMFRGKITQGISQRELLLVGCQNLFPVGSMVDRGVEGLGSRQLVRNTFNNRFLKISHIVKCFV